ncbi:3-deoxy-D-manno-octulosonic acid transferase [Hydrogenobacter hydrogenophilus]|uniref:3-deoxy-D-manno-octulosonic acid transferase n=1 Tax=Hydrogenobacter hydrogenophilus TaxID=35835 RepID=A0A285NRG6_9AQUI|nr:glycosyltransferase N-terminal domain-containing protein [Hydrogenobacter hydrogenophilus]SNZ12075.1 3-deoxy-D-manno-octulosonic-acid transferase [Hydrogenobacter hydrogenophilus]
MKTLWFHVASVGEFNTLKPILKELIKEHIIVLTYFSPRAKNYLSQQTQYYHTLERLPLDTPFTVRFFEKRISAQVLLIMEREFWPFLIYFTKTKKVLLNAYAKGGIYERFISKKFDLIITKTQKDKEKFESYGCKQVVNCGNLKFILEDLQEKHLDIQKSRSKFFVAGSTHRGEEEILLEAFVELKKLFPDLKLLIAPRHISRANEVMQKFKGFKCALKTSNKEEWDVLVIDTLGELFEIYSFADVAFVGGTLVNVGGHNLLEPAYHRKPVLFGPFLEKVKDMADYLIERNAGFLVRNSKDIVRVVENILTGKRLWNPVDIKANAERIKSCYLRNIRNML